MGKLISCTDYVLKQDLVNPNLPLIKTDWNKEFERRFKNVVNYANFLKSL